MQLTSGMITCISVTVWHLLTWKQVLYTVLYHQIIDVFHLEIIQQVVFVVSHNHLWRNWPLMPPHARKRVHPEKCVESNHTVVSKT